MSIKIDDFDIDSDYPWCKKWIFTSIIIITNIENHFSIITTINLQNYRKMIFLYDFVTSVMLNAQN